MYYNSMNERLPIVDELFNNLKAEKQRLTSMGFIIKTLKRQSVRRIEEGTFQWTTIQEINIEKANEILDNILKEL